MSIPSFVWIIGVAIKYKITADKRANDYKVLSFYFNNCQCHFKIGYRRIAINSFYLDTLLGYAVLS